MGRQMIKHKIFIPLSNLQEPLHSLHKLEKEKEYLMIDKPKKYE